MKRILVGLAASTLVLSACGSEAYETTGATAKTAANTQAPAEAAPTAEAPADETTEEPAEEPAEESTIEPASGDENGLPNDVTIDDTPAVDEGDSAPDAEKVEAAKASQKVGEVLVEGSAKDLTLETATVAYGMAVTDGDYGVVYDMSCQGMRGKDTRAEFAEYLSIVPQLAIAVVGSEVNPGPPAESILPEPGGTVTQHALVTYDVLHGSEIPETTLTVRFVDSGDGWQTCGTLPPI